MKYSDFKDEVSKIVDQKNSEFNKSFNEARQKTSKIVVEKYMYDNPQATEEEVKTFLEDYLSETPDELMRQFRLYSNSFGALFNISNQLLNEVQDIKEIYIALNEQKIDAISKKRARESQSN